MASFSLGTQRWDCITKLGSSGLLSDWCYIGAAAAMLRGRLLLEPTTVWDSYLAPWSGLVYFRFRGAIYRFGVCLVSGGVSVPLRGRRPPPRNPP